MEVVPLRRDSVGERLDEMRQGSHLVGGVKLLPNGSAGDPLPPKLRPVPKPRPRPRKSDPMENRELSAEIKSVSNGSNHTHSSEADDINVMSGTSRVTTERECHVTERTGHVTAEEASHVTGRTSRVTESDVRTSHVTDIRSLWENEGQHQHINGSSRHISKEAVSHDQPGHTTSHVTIRSKIAASSGTADNTNRSSMIQNILNLRIRANSLDKGGEVSSENGLERTRSVGSNCSSGSPSPSHKAPMADKRLKRRHTQGSR